jgi:hypothetical protein
MTTTANGSDIAMISKATQMLDRASTIDEIRQVENLAQCARDYAKAAGRGRDAVNSAARIALDARRKSGTVLIAMKERGELAERGRTQMSQRATFTLKDLNLTRSRSSCYQQEASVPKDAYENWVRRVIESDDRVLSAGGLRRVARKLAKSDEPDDAASTTAAAEQRVRRYIAKHWRQIGPAGRARLPALLKSLAIEYEAIVKDFGCECTLTLLPVDRKCRQAVNYEI